MTQERTFELDCYNKRTNTKKGQSAFSCMGRLGVNLWVNYKSIDDKKGSLQEVRGRSRVVPGPESDPRGSGTSQKKGHPAQRK